MPFAASSIVTSGSSPVPNRHSSRSMEDTPKILSDSSTLLLHTGNLVDCEIDPKIGV